MGEDDCDKLDHRSLQFGSNRQEILILIKIVLGSALWLDAKVLHR